MEAKNNITLTWCEKHKNWWVTNCPDCMVDNNEESIKREVVEFANKFLFMAEHGDYSNGNDAFGIDEGRFRAGELLDSYRKEWQAFLKENGLDG